MSKFVLLIFILLLSQGIAAATSVELDASCKVVCAELVEIESDQGYPHQEKEYSTYYFDLVGLTRQEVDGQLSSRSLKLCKQSIESKDCLYFKH